MPEKSFSIQDVIYFLESARYRRAMNPNTARTRKTALIKIKEYLTSEEQKDLRKIDPKALAVKVREQGDIQEGTIQTYLTRLRKSIDAYASTNDDVSNEKFTENILTQQSLFGFEHQPKENLVIAIDGLIIRVIDLPTNLSMAEAEKICSVLRNYANRETS